MTESFEDEYTREKVDSKGSNRVIYTPKYPDNKSHTEQDLGKIIDNAGDIPAGRAYLVCVGAEMTGMYRAAVLEKDASGYPAHRDWIKFDPATGEITVSDPRIAPTDAQQQSIKEAWPRYTFPTNAPFLCSGTKLPRDISRFPFQRTDEAGLSVFWNERGDEVLMVEERIEKDDGRKVVLLWTPWSDGKWRIAEPDLLPLYNLDKIKNASTIYVHEGAKSAKFVQELIEGDGWKSHPWGEELRLGVHVGWVGGANRPMATDWEPLIKAAQAGAKIIFIADNDDVGKSAVQQISKLTRMSMDAILFTDEFSPGWDLADEVPDRFRDGQTPLWDFARPATRMTKKIQSAGRGPPSYALRKGVVKDWIYTVIPDRFFNRRFPGRAFTADEVNALCRPFSDVQNIADLIRRELTAQADGVAFAPGRERIIQRDKQRLVNCWSAPLIKPLFGSVWLLGRLLTHLVPNRKDRKALVRWGATLVARPEIRMEYAVVLKSEQQGTGKTTLGNILAKLVGSSNTSRPNETMISNGQFNSWAVNKRFILVDELYSGNSKKTYNILKTYITDTRIQVNEKFLPAYETDCCAHFLFTSNDMIPMLIDGTDRRLFIPILNEKPLPREFWVRFHDWLNGDGLGLIAGAAKAFVERHGPVKAGERAPDSSGKRALIDASISDGMRAARDMAEAIHERGKVGEKIAFTLEDFNTWHSSLCQRNGWKRISGNRLKQELVRAGLFVRDQVAGGVDERVVIGGRKQRVALNFEAGTDDKGNKPITDNLKGIEGLFQETM